MLLSKHKNHRNPKYLDWLRGQKCAVSGSPAECAHHIRLGTNGGTGIKPSDYFCLPLLNEFHTTGPDALHIIGEETFLTKYGIEPMELFAKYLKDYLSEKHDVLYGLESRTTETAIAQMIELIESKGPSLKSSPSKKKKKKKSKEGPSAPKISDSEFYEKAKELKNQRDRELREKLKSKGPGPKKSSFKGNDAYEKAKEMKRERDKELRAKLKKSAKKVSKTTKDLVSSELYEKAKEYKKAREKELRQKLKEKHKSYRKELKKKLNKKS